MCAVDFCLCISDFVMFENGERISIYGALIQLCIAASYNDIFKLYFVTCFGSRTTVDMDKIYIFFFSNY